MEARELRIGNWVSQNGNLCKIYQVEHRYKDVFRVNDLDTNKQELEPIPLTPEWLERFGFKRGDFYELKRRWIFGKSRRDDGYFSINEYPNGFYPIKNGNRKVEYVHQLQNLYYALTGTELTIRQ